jgi:hypothetical protein
MLGLLSYSLQDMASKELSCADCKRLFRDSTVRGASEHVAVMPPQQKKAFLDAAQGYESWFLTTHVADRAARMVETAPVRIARAYRYL